MIDQVIIENKKDFIFFDDMKRDFPMERPHYHNYYELYFLLSGSCKFSVENHIYTIHKNEMLLIPPYLIHGATDYPQMSHRFIVFFPVDCLCSEFHKNLSLFTKNSFYIPNDPEYVLELMQNIRSEVQSTNTMSHQAAHCYLQLLLTYIIRNDSSTQKSTFKSSSLSLVEKMMKYISNNSHNDISVSDLSQEFGFSESYISRLFKNASGIGFKEYVTLQRLKNAEIMLNTTELSIQEISMSCGFNDSNYFSSTFKKHHGMSPTKYRKQIYKN